MIELFDTHAHLCDAQFAPDRADALRRAADKGVLRVVEIADAPAEWDAALALAKENPGRVRCTLGLHPYYADQFSPALLQRMDALRSRAEVVGIGEIGLDYVKTDIPREVQQNAFAEVLSKCREWDVPAVVHCRGAYPDLIDILRRVHQKPRASGFWGVVHCFSGTKDEALACRDLGFALGADGPVTYPKNDPLREALKEAGLACLVLETDSPYLPPQSSRGKRNEPGAIREIAEKLSTVFGVSLDELAARTTANAAALYRL